MEEEKKVRMQMSGEDTIINRTQHTSSERRHETCLADTYLDFDQNVARASLDPRRIVVFEDSQRSDWVIAEAVVDDCLVTFVVVLVNTEGVSGTSGPWR